MCVILYTKFDWNFKTRCIIEVNKIRSTDMDISEHVDTAMRSVGLDPCEAVDAVRDARVPRT